MKLGQEFHGHEASEAMMAAILKVALAMNLRVSSTIYDKRAMPQDPKPEPLPAAKDFPALAALSVLEPHLARQQVAKIWYDEDIKGKPRKKAFHTSVQRLNRRFHPDTPLEIRSKPSQGSELIQIADIAAYSLSLMVRSMIKTEELRQCIAAIQSDSRHQIFGPKHWGV